MDHERQILSELIDSLERRAGNDSNRAVYYDLTKKLPEYRDQYDDTLFNEVNVAIDSLLSKKFITAKRDDLGYYNKICLNCDNIVRHMNFSIVLQKIKSELRRNVY